MSNTHKLLPLKLLGLLYPPHNQIGLLQVLENLSRILEHPKLPIPIKVLNNTKDLTELIQVIAKDCSNSPNLDVTYDIQVNTRLDGMITRHPLWSLLYVDNRTSPYIRGLQAAALEATHGAHHKKIRAHDLEPFGRLIRYISLKGASDIILQFSPYSYKILKKSVTNILEKKLINIHRKTIHNSLRLLKVINNENVNRRSKSKNKSKIAALLGEKEIPGGKLTTLVEGDPDDVNASEELLLYTPYEKEQFSNLPLTKEEIDELIYYDVDIEELEPKSLSLILNNGFRSRRAEFILKKHKVSAVRDIYSRVNLALTNSYDLLTDHEIAQVYQIITKLRDSDNFTDKKLSLALLIMLATSSNISRISNFSILTDESEFNSNSCDLAYIVNIKSWFMPVSNIPYKTEEIENPSQARSSKNSYILLPDQFDFSSQFQAAGMMCNEPSFKDLDLKKLLKDELPGHGDRITLSKISRFQVDTAKSQYDPVLVQHVFGTFISTASTRQYYSIFKVREAIDCYMSLGKELSDLIGIPTIECVIPKNSFYIGARYVANTNDIKSSINKIEHEIFLVADNDLVARHNWLTVKCIFIQSIFTAIRAIRDPFISSKQLEVSNNALIFQDKSGADFNHVRFQPKHQNVQRIASFYKQHREQVIKQLPQKQQLELQSMGCETFILTNDLNVLPARPKTLLPFWRKISDYPINSNRKFLRNKLRYSGVDQHAIDTLMGHHSEGEAIWNSYNTSSLYDIERSLYPAFQTIIKELNINEEWNYVK